MNKYTCLAFSVLILTGSVFLVDRAVGQELERSWRAYWLTGGPHAENGYGGLLLSRLTLEELVNLQTPEVSLFPKPSPQALDAPAIWIETNSRSAVWNSGGQPIKAAPAISKYRPAEQKIKVGDFDFEFEQASMTAVIDLLKQPWGQLHHPAPPFYGMENTSKALLAMLEAELSAAGVSEGSSSGPEFKAYVLTGSDLADGGNRWLLLSQVKIEDLVVSDSLVSQETPAVWVLTGGPGPERNVLSPLRVPPPITRFEPERQLVSVGGVEYRVEAIPFHETIALLRKEQEIAIRSSIGPLYISNPTARALKVSLDAEATNSVNRIAPTKLTVSSTFGSERSVIVSAIGSQEPGLGVLHGPHITLGAEKRLRELAVYDNGFLERRETYIDDGLQLVHEQFSREINPDWHNGNGYRRVDGKAADGAKVITIAEGYLIGKEPWHGTFVCIEDVPDDKPFESAHRLVLRKYSEGQLISQNPDVTLGFGAKEKDENWLTNLPVMLKDR